MLDERDRLADRLGVRSCVHLLETEELSTPATAGVVWPVILLPFSFVTALPPDQLRAVLAHELAHIRRHDYLVNLVQLVVEALLFFNPAVWWISRQVRLEREACCDASAVEVTGQPSALASTLLEMASGQMGRAASGLAPAFAGEREPSSAAERIRRLLLPGHRPTLRLPWMHLAVVLLLCGLGLVALQQTTNLAVHAAVELLTPHERMERLQTVRREHAPAIEDRDYGEEHKLTIAGVVRTADGSRLPDRVDLSIRTERPHHGGTHGISLRGGGRESDFDYRIDYSRISVIARAEGYGEGASSATSWRKRFPSSCRFRNRPPLKAGTCLGRRCRTWFSSSTPDASPPSGPSDQ